MIRTKKRPATASALAIFALGGLVLAGSATAPKAAYAADLGGNCCADLEERVAELEATTARKGNRKTSLTITGRVNYNVLWWNENSTGPRTDLNAFDTTRDVYFGNVGRNESEFVFKGDGKINGDVSAGFLMEIFNDPSAAGGDAHTQITDQHGPFLQSRATYVFLKSKTVGEARLGYMYGAVHDGFYSDLGVDTIGRYAQTRDVAKFRLRDVTGQLVSSYGSILKPIEDSRDNQIQYISPAFAGFSLKADVSGSDAYGASLGYDNKFGTISLKAAIGYESATEADATATQGIGAVGLSKSNLRVLAASASIAESGSGLYLTGEYARAYADITGRDDVTNWFVKGGWQKNVNGLGTTAIYGSYFRQDNLAANGTTGHVYAIGIDQAIDSVASNIYLQYQRDSFDTDGVLKNGANAVNAQSIDAVIGGMIVRF